MMKHLGFCVLLALVIWMIMLATASLLGFL